MSWVLGLDTSNYTTSAAAYDGSEGQNCGRLLSVPEGQLGLRQQEALFQHIRALPDLIAQLRKTQDGTLPAAIGASTRPRAVEGSYMPCFLAGESQGRSLAAVLRRPFYAFSHQQGHLAAAAWSAQALPLLDAPFLAWHLSGGTTELLLVRPAGLLFTQELLGGTTDLAAGQLLDRSGKALSLPFPAGRALDELACAAPSQEGARVKVQGCRFSLSGVENQVQALLKNGASAQETAVFVLNTLLSALRAASQNARRLYPGLPILWSGGVTSSRYLRVRLTALGDCYFAQPSLATDNALGVALLTHRLWKEETPPCPLPSASAP